MTTERGACDGCDVVTTLRPFKNKRRYCLRCAEEIIAHRWAEPEED